MRIALIGSFRAKGDEGMARICGHFAALARQHQVLTIQTADFCRGRAWRMLSRFRPDCLHYLTGPTIFSLIALKLHQLTLPGRVATGATGLRPYLGRIGRILLPWLAPDFYLSQARRWQRLFSAAGSRTTDFPNGVETSRFVPCSPAERQPLKAQWNLPLDRPVVLHVGHVKPNRNLDCFIDVQRSGRYQVWIIGSESESQTGPWQQRLEEAGCRVHTQFVPHIEQVYQAADAYVFTVRPTPPSRFPAGYQEVGVIDFPLSILEAMASGLPVVTTRHDAVEHFLGSVAGLRYFDGTGLDCLRQLDAVRSVKVETRAAAERFDIARVMGQLESVYRSVAGEPGGRLE